MRTPIVRFVTCLAAALPCAHIAGCAGESPPSAGASPASEAEGEYVGVLMSGFAGIGGEHTGWMLEREGSPALEVDVSRVFNLARRLNGRRVVVRGRVVERDYLERGPTPVLVASGISGNG